jgi:hypothetical protein
VAINHQPINLAELVVALQEEDDDGHASDKPVVRDVESGDEFTIEAVYSEGSLVYIEIDLGENSDDDEDDESTLDNEDEGGTAEETRVG